MANHIQRAYKLKLDAQTVLGSTGEGRLTVYNEDGVTPTVDLSELSIEVATLTNCAPCYAAIGISNFDLESTPTPYTIPTTTRLTASGTAYVWATGSTLAAPTVSQIKNSNYSFVADTSENVSTTIEGLTPNTSYKVYVYAEDAEGNNTVIGGNGTKFMTTTTEAINIDSLSAGTPTSNSIAITTTLSHDGLIYLWPTGTSDTAPSSAQLKTSTFTGSGIADTAKSITVTDLTASASYKVYAYAENSLGQGTLVGNAGTTVDFSMGDPLLINAFYIGGGGYSSLDPLINPAENGTGYVYAVLSGASAPSISQIKENGSSATLPASTLTSISAHSLDADTAYTVYGYVENSSKGSEIQSASARTYASPDPNYLNVTGTTKSTQFSIFHLSPVAVNLFALPYISGTSTPSTAALEASSYTVTVVPNTPSTLTFTGLTANTEYAVALRKTWDAGVIAQGAGNSTALTALYHKTAAANPNLISDGLMARFFGWNDPDYVNGSDSETVTVLEGGSVTPSSHDVITSTIDFGGSKTLTGVFKNMAYNRTSATGTNGLVMTGIEFDGNNDHITLPQLQNNSKGAWDTDFEFLEGNSTDDAAYGFSITFWIKPKWGIDHGPSSNQDYKPWNLGNSSARSVGLYHKFDGSDRPAQLRGNSSNYAYSDSASNPPDPWDELYDEDNWTFMSIVYNGQELAPGYSADKASSAFMVGVGTGLPSAGDIFFYSGDGSAAGIADDFTVQGANYAGYGSTSNSLLDMTQNYCATIGTALKSDGSLQNNDLSYWPGYICDFRLYNRQITTGEMFSIFTGRGVA